jgi:hypothetical protein
MSYKYGTNGNDLDWSAVECLNSYCVECRQVVREFVEEVRELCERYGFSDFETDNLTSTAEDSIRSEVHCEGHTIIYSPLDGDDFWDMFAGKKSFPGQEWHIVHNTNNNFVDLIGDVPDEYLTKEYRAERDEELGEAV